MRNKRRIYLINKDFQYKFIIKVYMAVFLSIAAVGSLLFLFNDNKLSFSAYQQVLNLKSARDLLLPTILGISSLTAVVTLFFIVFRFVRITHKIAGPAYRFKKMFESVEYGDLTTKMVLRSNDEMQDMAQKFNSMVSSLHGKLAKCKNTVLGIEDLLNSQTELDKEKIEQLRKLVVELEDNLSTLKTENS